MSQGCSEVIPVINRDELIMRMMGSLPLALRMLDRFVASGQADCDSIESAVRNGDRRAIASLTHRLRGAAQTLALARVSTVAGELEQAALSESIPHLLMLVEQLRSMIDEVRQEVGEFATETVGGDNHKDLFTVWALNRPMVRGHHG
jgi:HPt (histidine-containing phosphotransfer) domain-containing protein